MTGRAGFVLIAALWLVVLISAASLDLGLRNRARRLTVANSIEMSRARAAAEAGIEHLRSRLARSLHRDDSLAELFSRDVLAAGLLPPDTFAMGAMRYSVAVIDPHARLNINTADEEQLRVLLRALRVDYGMADRIAQAVADWRDADDEHRARGAERDTYLREGLPRLPANGDFRDTDELRWVRGVTPDLMRRVGPYITVQGNGLININSAQEPVLLTVPGLGPDAIATILRLRRAGRPVRRFQELADLLPPADRQRLMERADAVLRRITFETREVEVISTGWADGSPVRVRVQAMVGWSRTAVVTGWRTIS